MLPLGPPPMRGVANDIRRGSRTFKGHVGGFIPALNGVVFAEQPVRTGTKSPLPERKMRNTPIIGFSYSVGNNLVQGASSGTLFRL